MNVRKAIEEAMRLRYGDNARIAVETWTLDDVWHGAEVVVTVDGWLRRWYCAPRKLSIDDSLAALAVACGMRITDDGVIDPAAEVESLRGWHDAMMLAISRLTGDADRLTRERDEARSALREYAPRDADHSPHAEAIRSAFSR